MHPPWGSFYWEITLWYVLYGTTDCFDLCYMIQLIVIIGALWYNGLLWSPHSDVTSFVTTKDQFWYLSTHCGYFYLQFTLKVTILWWIMLLITVLQSLRQVSDQDKPQSFTKGNSGGLMWHLNSHCSQAFKSDLFHKQTLILVILLTTLEQHLVNFSILCWYWNTFHIVHKIAHKSTQNCTHCHQIS